jgi:hypothetical protein
MNIETVHKMLFFVECFSFGTRGLNMLRQGQGTEKTLQKKNPSTTTNRQMKACTLD